ncbi:MAG: IS3 family transposase [Acidimicrobiales bacterium]
MSRYRFVSAMKADGFPVLAACEAAEVSASSYYDWLVKVAAGPSAAEWDEAVLVNEMHDVHRHIDDTYGSPRMTDELRRRGHCVNHKRTERLMAANGLYAKDGRRKRLRTTIPDVTAPPLLDLVKRNFAPGAPAERSCGDITYVPTTEGWLYLADVEDIGSRRIVGFAMADHMRTELVSSALEMAVAVRGGLTEGMIFHHDRGSQYMSREFRSLCERHGIAQSTGRTGSCHDNAVAESFWASLKRELVSRVRFATRAEARRAIIGWINHYNAVRLHSSLGNVPPIEWELGYYRATEVAA